MSAPDWMLRAAEALTVLKRDPAFWALVRSEVDAFFAAHPEEPATDASRDLMTVIVFRRLTTFSEETRTQKTA